MEPQGFQGLRLITRHIIRECLKILSLALATFFLIYFVVELFERINVIIVYKASLYLVLEYFLYTIPLFLTQTLPFATLLATLITLGIFSRNNEIVAMKAHGISTYRIIFPLFVLAASVTVLIFFCNETIVPYCTRKAYYVWSVKIKKEEERAFFRLNKIWYHSEDVIYNIRLLEPKKDILKGVTIYRFDKEFSLRQRIDAHEARWKGDAWTFYQVVSRKFPPRGGVITKIYQEKDIPIPEKPEDFEKGMKRPEEMSYRELQSYVERLRREGYDSTRYVVDLHAKVAFPFLSLIMVMIGSPLALMTGQRRGGGIAQGVGISIVLGFIYWLAFSLSIAMGHAGALPPLVAAWAPNVFFGLVGGYILESIRQ
ncbi:MAG: LPS export ABC transporter permease LptG [Deltaproteobacteria bacterium]|nr:MAG: LPS export ABC transporter permease LptG [Deltaproteobacteria bacterium]